MPLIDVRLDERVPAVMNELLGPSFLDHVLDTLAAVARAEWVRLAQRGLHTSKEEYIRGIQEVEVQTDGARVVALLGWLPNAVEQGLPTYDLRATLLGSGNPSRKMAADGSFYAAVPFRHSGPTSAGAAGTPMGSSYAQAAGLSRRASGSLPGDEAKSLGKEVYEYAKRMKGRERMPSGLAPLLAPHHRSDIYAGMIRQRHAYGKAVQTTYRTFRTISSKTGEGWIHPGIEAHHLAEQVEAHVARLVPSTIDRAFKSALGEIR